MPPKVMQGVVSYTTDPATKRTDLRPAKEMGQSFQGLHLADFSYQINLLATAQPSDPWRIFRLFITTEMVAITVSFANEKASQLPREDLKPRGLLKSWYPVIVEETFAYIGIRVYMGLSLEARVGDYWATGANKPTHPPKEVVSSKRYEAIYAIYARIRLATADPEAEFEAVLTFV